MGKCLFFDADGTILDIVKGTPEDTKLALQQLRKNGHKTFICTGRSNAFVPEYLMKEIGFDGLIANLGAYIEYNGTRVFEREMPTDLAWKTVEIIKQTVLSLYWKAMIICTIIWMNIQVT